MNGTRALLDTNFIILASKNEINVEEILKRYNEFYVSIITLIEVYGYNFKSEEEKSLIDELFESFAVIDVNTVIADQVINYRRGIKKIKIPDAIILATARVLHADLLTNNLVDFKGIDNQVAILESSAFE